MANTCDINILKGLEKEFTLKKLTGQLRGKSDIIVAKEIIDNNIDLMPGGNSLENRNSLINSFTRISTSPEFKIELINYLASIPSKFETYTDTTNEVRARAEAVKVIDPLTEYSDRLEKDDNTKIEKIEGDVKMGTLQPPFLTGSRLYDLSKVHERYFVDKLPFVTEFNSTINFHMRNMVLGTVIGPNGNIGSVPGPTRNMTSRYTALVADLNQKAKLVKNMTQSQINIAFLNGNPLVKSSYYAFVAVSNLELFLDIIAPGATIALDSDPRGIDEDKKKYKREGKYNVLKIYAEDLSVYKIKGILDIEFDYANSDEKSRARFVDEFLNTEEVSSVKKKFLNVIGLPNNYTSSQFKLDFPGLDLIADNNVVDKITNKDVFVLSEGNLIKASPKYVLTQSTTDKHKTGHEEDFNAFDNDTTFIKFLVKSTPRLRMVDGELVQDTDSPFLTDAEFYAIVTEISSIPDRSFKGISAFLQQKAATDGNKAKDTVYRSLYYAYFASDTDAMYSYKPVLSPTAITNVSLGTIASMSKLSFGIPGGATDMMSAMVQFFSKQTIGRLYFKDNELVEFNTADLSQYEIVLPDNIVNAMMVGDGKVSKEAAKALTVSVDSEEDIDIGITVSFENKDSKFDVAVTLNEFTFAVKMPEDMALSPVIIRSIFSTLNLPPRFKDLKFITKLHSRYGSKMPEFIGRMVAVAAIRDVHLSSAILEQDGTSDPELIKEIIQEESNQASFKRVINFVSEVYEEEFGLGSPTYDITAEGEKASRYTNIDREGQLSLIRARGRNLYAEFGIDTNAVNGGDIYDYTDGTGVIKSDGLRMQKDSIEKDDQLYANSNMTVQMRLTHQIEGGFLTKLDGYESNTFYVQPMVYSDRSSIYMYKHTFEDSFDIENLNPYKPTNETAFLHKDNVTGYDALKKNYIQTYRGKYDAMQFNVVKSWVDFLLGEDIVTWGTPEGVDIAKARAVGYKLAALSRSDMAGKNVLAEFMPSILDLKIPYDVAYKSGQVSKGLTLSKHVGVAIPTPNASLMAEYLAKDANAVKFLNKNIKNTLDTFSHPDIDFNLSEEGKEVARRLFGRQVSKQEIIAFYHLSTAPVSDSILDALMSPDTEYGKNNSSIAVITSANPHLMDQDFGKILYERSENFKKQSKRVQSMGTKGIRPRQFRSAGHYKNSLPKNDRYFGITDTQQRIVNEAHPDDKFSAAIASGIFTAVNGNYLTENAPAITVGGYTNFLISQTSPDGLSTIFALDTQMLERKFVTDPSAIVRMQSVVDTLNTLQIKLPAFNTISSNGPLSAEEYSALQNTITYSKISALLENDEGELGLGIEDVSKQILINEDDMAGYANLLGALGVDNYDKWDSVDAVQWAHPMYFLKLNGSLGNDFSSFSTDGSAVKDLTQYVDPVTGRLVLQKKSTQNIFSNEILRTVGNENLHAMFKKMNTAVSYETGISVLVPLLDSTGKETGQHKSVFVRNYAEAEAHPDIKTNPEILTKLAAFKGKPIEGMVMEVPVLDSKGEPTEEYTYAEFKNQHELWTYFGSYLNDNSWKEVARVLALTPRARNAYVEKVGFTSGQKTGLQSVNKGNVLFDPTTKADQIAYNDVPNEAHVVMLQKYHENETSDAVGHPSTLSVPSQFISALMFEGRTLESALNATIGVSTLTTMHMHKFFAGVGRAIANSTDERFSKEEAAVIFIQDGTNKIKRKKKFSELLPSEIDSKAINQFLSYNSKSFLTKLYKKMTVEHIQSSLDENADSMVLIRLMYEDDIEDVNFNSLILREKAVTSMRSRLHGDNVKITVPGVIAVTAASDFVTSIYDTSAGRLPRIDAIKYHFESENYDEIKAIKSTDSAEEFADILENNHSVLDTDKVRVTIKGATRSVYAMKVAALEGVEKVEYVEFMKRGKVLLDNDGINGVENLVPGDGVWAQSTMGKTHYANNTGASRPVMDFDTYFRDNGKKEWKEKLKLRDIEGTKKANEYIQEDPIEKAKERYLEMEESASKYVSSVISYGHSYSNKNLEEHLGDDDIPQRMWPFYKLMQARYLSDAFKHVDRFKYMDTLTYTDGYDQNGKTKAEVTRYWITRKDYGDKYGEIFKYAEKDLKVQLVEEEKSKIKSAQVDNNVSAADITIHSGGAKGADSAWDTVGAELGVVNINHYYAGNKTPLGNIELTDEELAEGIVEVQKAGKILNKNPKKKTTLDLLGRNWFQVKNSTQVVGVANIAPDMKTVEGGTGWAIAMAQLNNKDISVFNQRDNKWYEWSGDIFTESSVPKLQANFAGIGSRQLTAEGTQAIRDAFNNTFTQTEGYSGDIEPDENTIFVFGSNPEGRHGAGAAKAAKEKFGAINGQGLGLQGNAYALPTKNISTITTTFRGQLPNNAKAGVKSTWQKVPGNFRATLVKQGINTTYDAIIKGYRTGTSRSPKAIEGLQVGMTIDVGKTGTALPAVITYISDKTLGEMLTSGEITKEEWSKREGWTASYIDEHPSVLDKHLVDFTIRSGERSIPKHQIIRSIKQMYADAKATPDKVFKVAYRDGKNLNGYSNEEMMQLFELAGVAPSNVRFSSEWVNNPAFKVSTVNDDLANAPSPGKGRRSTTAADAILIQAWNNAKAEAAKEGKILVGSQTDLLRLAKSGKIGIEAQYAINSEQEFTNRILNREDAEDKSEENIRKNFEKGNKVLKKFGKNVNYTNKFIGDIFEGNLPTSEDIVNDDINRRKRRVEIEQEKRAALANVKKGTEDYINIITKYIADLTDLNKDVEGKTMSSNRDLVMNKEGEVFPKFYAKLKFGNLNGFQLYNDLDTNLKGYRYTLVDGSMLENREEYQASYIINKDSELYFSSGAFASPALQAVWDSASDTKKASIVKVEKKRVRGRLRVFMERNKIDVTLPEAYAPNFNMVAFDMVPGENVHDVIGFSNNPADEQIQATKFFRTKMYKNKSKYMVDKLTALNEKNFKSTIDRLTKLALKDTNENRIAVYKAALKALQAAEKTAIEGKVSMNYEKILPHINDIIYAENKRQINFMASKRAKAFIKSLLVMPPRIPGQGKQSGAVMRIKSFVESNKNSFYAPLEFYMNTGQDNDIDTNNVITRAIDENGFSYEYKELVIKKGDLDSNGNPIDPKYYGQISLADGTLPKVSAILAKLETTISNATRAYSATLEKPLSDNEIQNIIVSKVKNKMKALEKGIQNYVIDHMHKVMSDPVNAVELATPISMDDLRATAEEAKNNVEGYDYNKHGINSFNSAWIAVLENLNMEGKAGIAHYANGQRTFSAILMVQNMLGRDLVMGTNYRHKVFNEETNKWELHAGNIAKRKRAIKNSGLSDSLTHVDEGFIVTIDGEPKMMHKYANSDQTKMRTISEIEAQMDATEVVEVKKLSSAINASVDFLGAAQAWENLSQLLSAATDNAKELLLSQLGANNDTNTLIATMIIMGFSFSDVSKFLNSPDIKKIFKEFNVKRNKFEFAHLTSFIELESAPSEGGNELLALLHAGDAMSAFRKVLTIAQDNKIDTRDLHKVLSPLYAKGISVSNLLEGTGEYIPENESEGIFNTLFFLKHHPQARVILEATERAEQSISLISDADAILTRRIKAGLSPEVAGPKMLSQIEYDAMKEYINEGLMLEYFNDKSIYLPTADGVLKYDLSNSDLREDGIFNIYKSVDFLRTKLALQGKPNAFLDAIEFKEVNGKKLPIIHNLMEAEISEKTKYFLAIKELNNLTGIEKTEAKMLLDALFIGTVTVNRGRESRNSLVSLFPDEYIEFSKELGTININDSAIKANIFNEEFMQYLTTSGPTSVGMARPPKDTEGGHEAEETRFDPNYGLKVLPSARQHDTLGVTVKIRHAKLKDDLFFTELVDANVINSHESSLVYLKLFATNAKETIRVNLKVDPEKMITLASISEDSQRLQLEAGFEIGLPAILGVEKTGKVLSYLGKGRYLTEDTAGKTAITTDTLLAELNPDLVFYGLDFRKGKKFELAKKSRSFNLGTSNTKLLGDNLIKVTGGKISTLNKNGVEIKKYTGVHKKAVLDYVMNNVNDIYLLDLATELKTAAKVIENKIAGRYAGASINNTDVSLFMSSRKNPFTLARADTSDVHDSWKEDKKSTGVMYTLNDIVNEYLESRDIKKTNDNRVTATSLIKSAMATDKKVVMARDPFKILLEDLNTKIKPKFAGEITITEKDLADLKCK
ncbi:MAG: hypothetical protein KAH32_00450 [Chlamydiia bacterium]|nr:hypothetical protein [Chlamydiia bacterium]